jgi:hypothetical protein
MRLMTAFHWLLFLDARKLAICCAPLIDHLCPDNFRRCWMTLLVLYTDQPQKSTNEDMCAGSLILKSYIINLKFQIANPLISSFPILVCQRLYLTYT